MSRLLFWILTLLFLSGCSVFQAKDNTDPPAELVDFTASLKLETLWKTSVAGIDEQFLAIRPVLQDGKLFIADPKGRVLALDPGNGKTIWETETNSPVSGGPGAAGDLILVGTQEAEVIALAIETGEERWRRRVSSEVLSSPAGELGVVVVRTIDGRVVGINAATGETRWDFSRTVPVLALRGNGSPLVKDAQVFIGFANGKLVSLSLDTGNLIWEAVIATPRGRTELERVVDVDADPVLVEGVVYSASYQGAVAAISKNSGVMLWQREMSSHAGLDADWRQLYLTDANDHVWSLDAVTGATLWQQKELHARKLSAPAMLGEYLVVGDSEGYVHWLAQEDGRLLARKSVGSAAIRAKPLVKDDIVYVFDLAGRLTALKSVPVNPE